jgi:hypothetical protein
MGEVMTIEEIGEQFDSEWVLLEDPEVSVDMQLLRGKVVCHSKNRDEVYQKAVDLKLKRSATLYAGDVPAGTTVAL